jgi:hypothetical protein
LNQRNAVGGIGSPIERVQSAFLAILPKVEQVARGYFRRLTCPDRKQECICEAVALVWKWHQRLELKGRDSSLFVSALARFAAKAVHSGRRLCGQEKANDVTSRVCQHRRGFAVGELAQATAAANNSLNEALRDNTQTAIPDQVQFRVDFSAWRCTLDNRRRRIMNAMMLGESTSELSNRFGMTSGRISQLRREFYEGYSAFCGESLEQNTEPETRKEVR